MSEPPIDPGLAVLVMLLRLNGHAADPRQIAHRYAYQPIGVVEMLRCGKEFGLKARALKCNWAKLTRLQVPCVASLRLGGFVVVGRVGADRVVLQFPSAQRPQTMERAEFERQWTGEIVVFARRNNLRDPNRPFNLSWFVGAIAKYRRLLAEVLLASFCLQVFGLVTPLVFQVVIDKVLVQRGMSTLTTLILALGAIAIFDAMLSFLRTYLFAHTTNRIDVELGARLFRHLMGLPLAYFQARRTGDSVARVRELENIRNFLTGSALTVVIDLFFTAVFFAVMFVYSTLLTAIVLAGFPVYLGISIAIGPLFRSRLEEKFNRGAENQSFLVESINGIETLKAMAVEPQMQQRWEEQLAGYVWSSFRVLKVGNFATQSVQLVSKLVTVATLFFGARLVIAGELSVGELVAFNMLASRVTGPIMRLAQMWQDFHQTRVSIARLGDILNTRPEPAFRPSRGALPPIRGSIVFDHVSFRYALDGPPILRDVSFSIKPGEVVGVVGASGSGKSTLAKLMQRLYIPEAGKVFVDNVDINAADPMWLRRQIGVVLQEAVLFNCSIRENIALTDPSMAMERVVLAAHLAGAHDFIVELPDGYDTIVGERGATLSGGQRQRIAIARALVNNPRILIFDEATSALDYESERLILENMKQIVRGRTVLVIAHRLSVMRDVHRILTIDHGRLIEDGDIDDLMKKDGKFAALHRLREEVP